MLPSDHPYTQVVLPGIGNPFKWVNDFLRVFLLFFQSGLFLLIKALVTLTKCWNSRHSVEVFRIMSRFVLLVSGRVDKCAGFNPLRVRPSLNNLHFPLGENHNTYIVRLYFTRVGLTLFKKNRDFNSYVNLFIYLSFAVQVSQLPDASGTMTSSIVCREHWRQN